MAQLTPEDAQALFQANAASFITQSDAPTYAFRHNTKGKLQYLKKELLWQGELIKRHRLKSAAVGDEMALRVDQIIAGAVGDLRWSLLAEPHAAVLGMLLSPGSKLVTLHLQSNS